MIKLFLALSLLVPGYVTAALQNQLKDSASPYLAMHSNDPVQWQDWGQAVLDLARKEDKLIYISSGYFSCHWCHVMQRESYQNPAIAAFLNKHFIPVKLDRELYPALDGHLVDFVQETQGSAGWPLNVFLTPEGYPLFGLTYQPPDNFRALLNKISLKWDEEREQTRDLARRALLQLSLKRQKEAPVDQVTPRVLLYRLEDSFGQYADRLKGGFGQQEKFPMTPQLMALLEVYGGDNASENLEFLQITLEQMARSGLRDHLGGGFFRYTVDPGWETPHYEKMLYTQALMADLYLKAGRRFNNDQYLQVGRDTLDFVLSTMKGKQGAYIASFSAVDDQGTEGGYYLWSEEQLKQVLAEKELRVARRYWDLQADPDSGEGQLPRRGAEIETIAGELKLQMDSVQSLLDSAKTKLLTARNKRNLPADTKELAGWNGLLLAALCDAADLDARYREPAARLRNNLMGRLWNGERLLRARDGDQPMGNATLQDYTFLSWGLSNWAHLTGAKKDQDIANKLLGLTWEKYFNEDGWIESDNALLPGMPRDRAQDDGALPSAAATVIRLSITSGDDQLQEKARQAMRLGFSTTTRDPFWYASHALALIEQSAHTQAGAVNQ